MSKFNFTIVLFLCSKCFVVGLNVLKSFNRNGSAKQSTTSASSVQAPKYLSAQVSKCFSSAPVPKCLKDQVSKCLECPSDSSAQVPEFLDCLSAQVPLECLSALKTMSASSVW